MPRNMSFALTTQQFRDQTKTVTRRKNWEFLKPGDLVMGCVKCMGLKPGEKIERLGLIRIVSLRREPLNHMELRLDYGWREVSLEGFPKMHPDNFVDMFCRHMGGDSTQIITRVEFEYVEANDETSL